ncbi:MAG: DNA primase [Pirellulaceae bacterium]|nr:DNA primase [Pirellulaceae bacterium]
MDEFSRRDQQGAFSPFMPQELPVSFAGSEDLKERVRQSVDICELVGEQIELIRQGQGFVGLCPWHNDSRPSLQVNPERQTWKCWVCDVGGDAFSFVMQREGVGFREALAMLAERAGISLQASNHPQPAPGSPDDKQTLYQAMAWASEQFHRYLLESKEAATAREYLQQRHITSESIAQFQIGFSPPDWRWLLTRAEVTPFSPQVLEAVGLILKSQRTNNWYDRFRGRVLFPIRDTQRRAIAIGGRILPELTDDKTAKYINSPETRLFSKSEQLYGLDLARDAITKQRSIVITEGYTDVVIVQQHGFENVVAVLGTALGPRHIQLIKRYADSITLLLDGDTAGQRRTNEILDLFVTSQVDLRIATLPAGLDPCDFVIDQGAAALQALLDSSQDAWDHKITLETAGLDPIRDTHRANRALESLLAVMAKAPGTQADTAQRLREQQLLNRLSRQFQIEESQLRDRLHDARQQQRPRLNSPDKPMETPIARSYQLQPVEQELLELLLRHPEAVPSVLEAIRADQLTSDIAKLIFTRFEQLQTANVTPTFERLLLSFDEPEVKTLLVTLDEAAASKNISEPADVVSDLIKVFERRQLEDTLRQGQAALESSNLDQDQAMDLLKDMLRKRQELIDS